MPRKKSVEIRLDPQLRMLLGRMQKGISWSLQEAHRADIVLRAAKGQTNYRIAKEMGVSRNTVKLWRYRFARERIAGLQTRPIPGRPKKVLPRGPGTLKARPQFPAVSQNLGSFPVARSSSSC